uniref:Uncharacterized protein n=1 Tax=Avena sativa TaxID=4498 RepID=A0ACD5XVG6_AVESA
MANYDYYGPPSPSPPPPDGHIHLPQQASISDLLLHLRRGANHAPADEHSRHRQHQQELEMHVINLDHRIPPVTRPDGTTTRCMIITARPHCPATAASTRRHHRANTAATPYHRAEHHERRSNRCHQGASKVVCLANMLSPGDRLEDDGFYQEFLEDATKVAHKFGELVEVVIPRPSIGGRAAPVVAGVGKVFLEYAHLDNAVWCRKRLDGKWYKGKEIAATFFNHGRFAAGDYA